MNSKTKAMLLSMLAIAVIPELSSNKRQYFDDEDIKPVKKIIPKGCSLFVIEGKEIIALNYKNALKKFNKQSHETKKH